jgi:hypothetical protein
VFLELLMQLLKALKIESGYGDSFLFLPQRLVFSIHNLASFNFVLVAGQVHVETFNSYGILLLQLMLSLLLASGKLYRISGENE